jgi:DNA mismatch endonuclease (patch repair protein)
MADKFTKAQRSRIMAAVKSKDTTPEIVVRRLVHSLGYRYRLHVRKLPGTPDIVLARWRKIININGCFWHMHDCRHGRIAPVANPSYWHAKRSKNAIRDRLAGRGLRRAGWSVLTIWECEMRDSRKLMRRIKLFLTG